MIVIDRYKSDGVHQTRVYNVEDDDIINLLSGGGARAHTQRVATHDNQRIHAVGEGEDINVDDIASMDDLDREWREEELVPEDEIEEEERWEREDEVFVDASLLNAVDVRDLIDAGTNWRKVFDPIPLPAVDETDEGDVIGGPEEPCVVDNIVVGAEFKTMTDFRMCLSDTIIKSNYEVFKVEAKKKIYSARCEKHGCPWKVRASLSSGWVRVTRYYGEHTCGQFRMGAGSQFGHN